MRILSHPDPIVLEQALSSLLDGVHPRGAVARSLVLVPTARLAAHVQRRLAGRGRRSAWVGVEVFTLHALAGEILARAGAPAPRVLSSRLREALVQRVLRLAPDNRWSRFIERRPGAGRLLAGALNELREASIDPVAVHEAAAGQPWDGALADLYASYVSQLNERRDRGWIDEAGLILAAVDRAEEFASSRRQILVHGAYEWIGVHARLLRALARHVPVTVLAPIRPGRRVTRHAEDHARSHLLEDGERIEPLEGIADRGCGLDLAALYDEESRPVPAAAGRFRFRHTQGAVQEIQLAVHAALSAVAGGCPPEEIAVVARSLEPYAAAIEAAFRDRGVNWTSSLTVPLRRQPIVRDFLLLLEVVAEGFPRRPTTTLLRSPRIRWTNLPGVDRAPDGDLAERWSRRARIIGGLDEWSKALSGWAEHFGDSRRSGDEEDPSKRGRVAEAGRIAATLSALNDRVATTPCRWSTHAERLRNLLAELFEPAADRDAERDDAASLGTLFDEMASLESVIGETDGVSFGRVRAWLEDAVEASRLAPWQRDRGGIRVLDAMQFRGLTFEHVFLVGMNSGVFPRRSREDPVLGDRLRRLLCERTGRPLVLSSDGPAEERVVLAMILGGSRSRIDVSWQRADDSGRARSTSLAMRELARLTYGTPDLERLHSDGENDERTVPSHPTQWLKYLAMETRVLSARDAVLLRVLEGSTDRELEALASTDAALGPGLRMVRATRAFEITESCFDARIGEARAVARFAVTALERLGRCPLQYFFRHVLGVTEPDEAATAEALSPAELGGEVHALLQRLYERLHDEGLIRADRQEALLARADAWLRRECDRLFGELGQRLTRRLPVLWELTRASWFEALTAFVRWDLKRIADEGWRADGFEIGTSGRIELGAGVHVDVHGRLDRRWVLDGRTLIGDYKTSGRLADRTSRASMLKGHELQVPLYWLLAGEEATVELLGVGPYYAIEDEEDRRATFAGFGKDEERVGFLETLRTLVELARRGRYPLHADAHCAWCAYRLACRRKHPPTLHRERLDAGGRRYALLQEKSTRRPLLEDVEGSHA